MRISDWSSDVCSSDLTEPLDNVPVLVAQRLGATRHPTMHAIRTTKTIVPREVLARHAAMAEVVSQLRYIVRMDGLSDPFQAAHSWLVHIRYIQAAELPNALHAKNRLPLRPHFTNISRTDVLT